MHAQRLSTYASQPPASADREPSHQSALMNVSYAAFLGKPVKYLTSATISLYIYISTPDKLQQVIFKNIMSQWLDNAVHGEVFCKVPPGAGTMACSWHVHLPGPQRYRRWPGMMKHHKSGV